MRQTLKNLLTGSVSVAAFSLATVAQTASVLGIVNTTESLQAESGLGQSSMQMAKLIPSPSQKPSSGELNLRGGNVFPVTAQPLGYSLERIATALAYFTTSGNNPSYYPNTPFQILYATDNTSFSYDPSTGVISVVGSNIFDVKPGTMLYVPIGGADNSPPVIGNFPDSSADVKNYIFGQDQMGSKYAIWVDGKKTEIDATQNTGYAVGPLNTPNLLNGGGNNMITVGVFLTPLSKGQHTIQIQSLGSGKALTDIYSAYLDIPVTAINGSFTYIVNVK